MKQMMPRPFQIQSLDESYQFLHVGEQQRQIEPEGCTL